MISRSNLLLLPSFFCKKRKITMVEEPPYTRFCVLYFFRFVPLVFLILTDSFFILQIKLYDDEWCEIRKRKKKNEKEKLLDR